MATTNLKVVETTRRSPVRDVQERILSVETSHDETIAGIGDLVASMLRVGAMAKVCQADGQQALDRAVQAMVTAARMRALVIATHQDLRDIYGKLDLRELGYGALGPSPNVSGELIEQMLAHSGAA